VSEAQISEAREEANRIIAENRPLSIHYCSAEEARARGVRKIAAGIERVRLIEIPRIDLNACGGTHVNATGEIGCILTRKVERVRQGSRVEFVCGLRAVQAATRDYQELRTAGEKLSSGAWAIAEQVDKILQESKSQAKRVATLESEVAQLTAAQIASQAKGMIVRRFDDRDASFVKLLAQNVVRAAQNPSIVIFAAGAPSPTLVLARTEHNELKNQHMGELLKSVLTQFGGRGGGSASFAQGGLSSASQIDAALAATAEAIAIAS
jgi:alanyl-tRNA synthetase